MLKATPAPHVEEGAAAAAFYEPQVLAVSPTSTYTKSNNLFAYLQALQDADGQPLGWDVFKLLDDGPAIKIFLPDGIKAAQNNISKHSCMWEVLAKDSSQPSDSYKVAKEYADAIIKDAAQVDNPNAWSEKLVKDFAKKGLKKHLEACKQELIENPGLLGKGFEEPITEENFDDTIRKFIDDYKKTAFIHFHKMAEEEDFEAKLIEIIKSFHLGASKEISESQEESEKNIHTGIMKTVEARCDSEVGKGSFKAGSDEALRFRDRNIRYLLLEQYAMKHKLLPEFIRLFYAGDITEMLRASIKASGKEIKGYWSQLELEVSEDAIEKLNLLKVKLGNQYERVEALHGELTSAEGKFTAKKMAAASSAEMPFEELDALKTGMMRLFGEVDKKCKTVSAPIGLLMAFLKKYKPDCPFAKQFPVELLDPTSVETKYKTYHLYDFMDWMILLSAIPDLLEKLVEDFHQAYKKLEAFLPHAKEKAELAVKQEGLPPRNVFFAEGVRDGAKTAPPHTVRKREKAVTPQIGAAENLEGLNGALFAGMLGRQCVFLTRLPERPGRTGLSSSSDNANQPPPSPLTQALYLALLVQHSTTQMVEKNGDNGDEACLRVLCDQSKTARLIAQEKSDKTRLELIKAETEYRRSKHPPKIKSSVMTAEEGRVGGRPRSGSSPPLSTTTVKSPPPIGAGIFSSGRVSAAESPGLTTGGGSDSSTLKH